MMEVVRRAFRDSGMNATVLAKKTGVSRAAISRFISGSDIRSSGFAKLCVVLGLELVKKS